MDREEKLKSILSKNLLYQLEKHDMNQVEFASLMGVTPAAVNTWTQGLKLPRMSKIDKMCEIFNISRSELLDEPQSPNPDLSKYGIISLENRRTKKIPILGEIACGVPIYAEETYNDYVEVDEDIKVDFALRTKGDSMIGDNIVDGDVVLVKKVSMVEPHEIAVVIINDEATLKRVKYDRENNIVMLIASNYNIAPIIYSGEELEQINILGKVVLLQRKY